MKKIVNYGLSLVLMAFLFLVTSCGKDPVETIVEAPTVTLPAAAGTETTVEVGETVAFKVSVTAPGVFNTFIVNQTIGSTTTEIKREGRASGTAPATYEYDFSFKAETEHGGQEIVFDFIAVDDANKESKATYTIIVNEVSLVEYETVLLGGQSNSTVESFYNVVDNVKYFYSAANETANKDKVDFLYHYGSTNGNVISSPDDAETRATWEDIYGLPLTNLNNSTRFKRVTATTYGEVNNQSQVVNAYVENQNAEVSRLTQLQTGETFAFVLDGDRGGRYGIVEVVEAKGEGVGGENRTITLKIKVQPTANN